MKKLILLVTVLMVVASACSPARGSMLARNRSLWDSQDIRHYRFELNISCFCVFHDQMPLTIEVLDGQAVSMSGVNDVDISDFRDYYGGYDTVEKLFGVIENAIGQDAHTLEVTYDPTYGYPVSIYINPDELVADAQTGYDVTNFQVLP